MDASGYRKLVFGCVIAGLCIWLGLSQLLPGPRPAEARPEVVDTDVADEILSEFSRSRSATSPALLDEWRALAAADWPADPFFPHHLSLPGEREGALAPDAHPSGVQPAFVLNAVISGDKPLAMINGLVVSVGDRLADGSVVTAIDSYAVSLKGPQGLWTLRLSE